MQRRVRWKPDGTQKCKRFRDFEQFNQHVAQLELDLYDPFMSHIIISFYCLMMEDRLISLYLHVWDAPPNREHSHDVAWTEKMCEATNNEFHCTLYY
jgi:hypothetical protein